MTIFLWIACGAIASFFLLTAIFSTRRELAWARMALRAMYGEPIAGERLRAMAVACKADASALLLELGRFYRSDYERHGKDYADAMARDVYARVAVAMVSPSRTRGAEPC